MNLLKTRQEVNNKLAIVRSIDRIINSEKFDVLFTHASKEDEQEIELAIKDNNRDGILNWIKSKSRQIDYNEVGIKELQTMARRLGVPNYGRLPKALLLYEINRTA